jgi:hypothetical protein
MYRFRLIDEDGADLGPFASTRPVWSVGQQIARSPTERFVVTNVVEPEEQANFRAYLVVRRC